MAPRSQGQRFQPVQAFIVGEQIRGQTNARQALRDYRQSGGSIRTQEWYRVWRESAGAVIPPQATVVYKTDNPTRWIAHVQVVYLDPRTGKTQGHWHNIYFPGPRRPSESDAIQAAINEGAPVVARKYGGWTPVIAYVNTYEGV